MENSKMIRSTEQAPVLDQMPHAMKDHIRFTKVTDMVSKFGLVAHVIKEIFEITKCMGLVGIRGPIGDNTEDNIEMISKTEKVS